MCIAKLPKPAKAANGSVKAARKLGSASGCGGSSVFSAWWPPTWEEFEGLR